MQDCIDKYILVSSLAGLSESQQERFLTVGQTFGVRFNTFRIQKEIERLKNSESAIQFPEEPVDFRSVELRTVSKNRNFTHTMSSFSHDESRPMCMKEPTPRAIHGGSQGL